MVLAILVLLRAAAATTPIDTVTVDLGAGFTPFDHYWKRVFGSGHATLTLRPDWQAHLSSAVSELGLQGVRYHGIFDDDMGVVVAPRTYNFSKVGASWDFQVKSGLIPIVELSFMPAILANCRWTSPLDGHVVNPAGDHACSSMMQYRHCDEQPQDYADWAHLVTSLVQFAVDRYSLTEVQKWHFEVWNEFWGMSFPDPYMTLYNESAFAVKAVDASLKVGGPASQELLDAVKFVSHARAMGAPFDFVSTHIYPTDPECPTGENWGPECLPSRVKALRAALDPAVPLFITEYNVGCCIGYHQHDTEGAAPFIFRSVAALDGVTDVLSWWTFTDIFEEEFAIAEHTEYMNIYGLKTISGIAKPGWRAFQLLHEHAGDLRVVATVAEGGSAADVTGGGGCREEVATNLVGFELKATTAANLDACCAACKAEQDCIFWTYFHASKSCSLKNSDAGRKADATAVSGSSVTPPLPSGNYTRVAALATATSTAGGGLRVFLSFWSETGVESARTVRVVVVGAAAGQVVSGATAYRIDADHANAHKSWQAMGSPPKPSDAQLSALVNASLVVPVKLPADESGVVEVELVPNSAVVLSFDWRAVV